MSVVAFRSIVELLFLQPGAPASPTNLPADSGQTDRQTPQQSLARTFTTGRPRSPLSGKRQPACDVAPPGAAPRRPTALTLACVQGCAGSQPHAGETARNTEYAHLLSRYEPSRMGHVGTSDIGNARTLAALQREGLRGGPQGAARFETRQQGVGAKISALPAQAQDYYRGAQAAFIAKYDCAGTPDERDRIAQSFRAFSRTVDHAYRATRNDPAQRVQSEFNPPYGAGYLREDGKRMGALLEHYRSDFNRARTPQQRETAFAQAAAVKHRMQRQIGVFVAQKLAETRQAWRQSCLTVENALTAARSLQSGDPYDQGMSFTRLAYFGAKVFTSPQNARAFAEMQRNDPARFDILKRWDKEVQDKTAWARQTIASDPFRRAFAIPEVPQSYLSVDVNTMPVARYGESLGDRYQNVRNDIGAAQELYHAASQRGPIKQAYIQSVMPPLPEWQLELEEIVCRLLLAPVPFGGLLADQFGPKSHMSNDMRTGMNIVCGVLGESGLSPLKEFPTYGEHIER